jgi:DNA-binding GntR family transcriptional regulator
LVSEAIVYRRQGSGTYPTVTTGSYIRQVGSVEDLMALSEDTTCELISPLEHKVDVDSASRLRLASDGVMQLTLRRFHGGHPFCFTSVTLPPRIGADLKGIPEVSVPGTQSEVTIIGLINARAPKLITDAEQSVSATVGPDFAMKHLTCDIGSPALRIDRLYFDGAGDPVELAISYFVPSLYSYRIRLRRQPL